MKNNNSIMKSTTQEKTDLKSTTQEKTDLKSKKWPIYDSKSFELGIYSVDSDFTGYTQLSVLNEKLETYFVLAKIRIPKGERVVIASSTLFSHEHTHVHLASGFYVEKIYEFSKSYIIYYLKECSQIVNYIVELVKEGWNKEIDLVGFSVCENKYCKRDLLGLTHYENYSGLAFVKTPDILVSLQKEFLKTPETEKLKELEKFPTEMNHYYYANFEQRNELYK